MGKLDQLTIVDMFRSMPIETSLFTVIPLFLVVAQLANSIINGLSLAISIPFAVGMLAFTIVLLQYRCAHFRREQAERGLF